MASASGQLGGRWASSPGPGKSPDQHWLTQAEQVPPSSGPASHLGDSPLPERPGDGDLQNDLEGPRLEAALMDGVLLPDKQEHRDDGGLEAWRPLADLLGG